MDTIKNTLIPAKMRLRDAGIPSYSLDAELLLAEVLDVAREQVVFYPERQLSESEIAAFHAYMKRREAREPMAHILGKREFFGRIFRVTKDTLDPRPDSETLIEAVLEVYKDRIIPLKILDLGTGTGCLLLTLLAEFPASSGVGVDLSPAALEVAKYNAKELGLEKHAGFQVKYWAEGILDKFDIIITNPPYIKAGDLAHLEPEVASYEPYTALVGGDDGLVCYRQLIPDIARLLTEGGLAVLEIGEGQEEEIAALLQKNQLNVAKYCKDLSGIIRCITAGKPTA